MLSYIQISNFKSILNAKLNLKNLTILTGTNSSGKSSVIQSILLLAHKCNERNNLYMEDLILELDLENLDKLKNNHKDFEILLQYENSKLKFSSNKPQTYEKINYLCYEDLNNSETKNLFYLNANRIGQEQQAKISKNKKVGKFGEYLFSTFESNKGLQLDPSACAFNENFSFLYQVNSWLSFIANIKLELLTAKEENKIKVSFNSNNLSDLNPKHLGAGISYLAKVIILCFIAKKGDTVIIENPEIHLHPKSQARLGAFFSFIASIGIQLIIETHSEHLINKIRHVIYKDKIKNTDVIIHYKSSIDATFEEITFNDSGSYLINDKLSSFPANFFDATLEEILEID